VRPEWGRGALCALSGRDGRDPHTGGQAARAPWPRAKLFTKKWVALKILFALPEFGKHQGFCIITALRPKDWLTETLNHRNTETPKH